MEKENRHKGLKAKLGNYSELFGTTENHRKLQGTTGQRIEMNLWEKENRHKGLKAKLGNDNDLLGTIGNYRKLQGITENYRELKEIEAICENLLKFHGGLTLPRK